ncbi:MAG TPA: chemotaxis protein CheW [Nannocystaceae bacterium]|nr:chemotaxis protein CheW [Nannocystaceae bacterium]
MTAVEALHVVFKVGTADYVLPATVVLEMESFAGATRVPGTAQHVAGLVHIRGRVIPLVDLRARFGLPPVDASVDQRVVVVDHDGRRIGLLVDMAREVAKIDPAAFGRPPELVVERASGFVKAVAQLGTRLVMLLDCERVLGQEQGDG